MHDVQNVQLGCDAQVITSLPCIYLQTGQHPVCCMQHIKENLFTQRTIFLLQ